jgi:sugar lactone lactonase YvrE
MRTAALAAALCAAVLVIVSAQEPASSFDRGHSLQAWQSPGLTAVMAKCKSPAKPFSIPVVAPAAVAPPAPALPDGSMAIPGVIADGQKWKVVWAWEGNNVDGPIAGRNGAFLVANNDASNVMQLDPATGRATVLHKDTNTGGALSRSKNGALFLAVRGLGSGIVQLEPTRKPLVTTYRGEPIDCLGGIMNDLAADKHGGVYFTITGTGVFYSTPRGVVTQYGNGVEGANGIVLSPDEKILYISSGASVIAFDVQPNGSLTNQREFGKLRGGDAGDGSAVDSGGRLYVATGASADVFAPGGQFLGSITGPQGMHGVAFGGRDKKTLFGIVFYGGWGTDSARNQVVAIQTLAQGYVGRAK